MAFYGNITNTSKTTFSFDRTYSNRYEMDIKANSDGVFVGRYVLVDYDENLDSQSYLLDAGNESVFLYDDGEKSGDFNLYINVPEFVTDKYGTRLYQLADQRTFYEFNKEIDDGRCLVLHAGHVISNTNKTPLYVQAIGYESTDDPNVQRLKIKIVTADAYNKYWQKLAAENNNQFYVPVTLDATTYEPYTFYTYRQEGGVYVMATGEFEEDVTYYDLGNENSSKMGIVNGYGVYFGAGAVDTEGMIYRVPKNHSYNLNTEMQYWAIRDWKVVTRLVRNPNYNIADPANNEEYILQDNVSVPVWGQLAARENNGVKITYVVHELKEGEDKTDFYIRKNGEYVRASSSDTGPFYEQDIAVDLIGVKDGQNYNYDDDYTVNMIIDRNAYGVSRGYDSTVWQKVYKNGKDVYVMVAELNSVVPTFGVEADAPTPVPLAPHFDPDSTNVYYRLHVQPSWGFRTKFANPRLEVPRINANGQILSESSSSRIDGKEYPSDQTTTWESDFYDKFNDSKTHKYFNLHNSTWEDAPSESGNDIPAAIYFNKRGFAPEVVTYSNDMLNRYSPQYRPEIASHWKGEDKIEVTPTGHSGMLYDNHGYGAQTTPAVDTQEFSVMLPSLGNAMAQIWDMIFGGRDTNEAIAQTSRRNMDYEWEDARKGLDRKGLRMVGNALFNGYNKSETNTLAGCINSVHDLMGMIIASMTPEELLSNIDNLDEDYVYYVQKGKATSTPTGELKKLYDQGGQFLMKHTGYAYTAVDEKLFTYEEVTKQDDNFDYSLYYVKEGSNYRPAKEGDTGPFYAKNVTTAETVIPAEGLVAFDGTKYYYNDGCAVDCKPADRLKMSDWVREAEYQTGRQYYSINPDMLTQVDVSQEFEAGKFYYLEEQTGNYLLSFETEADPATTYYIIQDGNNGTENRLVDIKSWGYQNVYSPGVYFYKPNKDVENYFIDVDDDGMWDHDEDGTPTLVTHYYAIKKEQSESNEIVQTIRYEKVDNKNIDPDNFDPSSYYIETQPGVYTALASTDKFDSKQTYYYKVISIVTKPADELYEVGEEVTLTPYAKNTFYRPMYNSSKELIGYEHLTANIIREMIAAGDESQKIYAFGVIDNAESTASANIFDINKIDTRNPEKYALYRQNVFYVPGLYHYINGADSYSDYILDIYPTMWHKGSYYQFTTDPTPVNEKFYEPHKYYTKVGEDYVLIKDNLTQSELNNLQGNIFERETYYVLEDSAKIFPVGSEWNPNVSTVPPTVKLGTRTKKIELRPLEGFARNLNTIHGLLLQINRMLLMNDEYTRDERTVQGAINLLNDKIAQFGEQRPNEVMVVDNYGRTQSALLSSLQKDTANTQKNTSTPSTETDTMIVADKYPIAASVDAMKGQWITMNVDGDIYHPKFTIHHNFQPVTSTDTTFDMNGNGDTFKFYTPTVDRMGHVVGRDLKAVTFPFGYKFFTTNGVSNAVTDITTGTDTVSADSTQDTFGINSGNKWIRMKTDAVNDNITIAHEIHTPVTTAIAGETDLDGNQTFVIQDMQFDAAGHITHNQAHTYRLPDGFKYVQIGTSTSSVANATAGEGKLEANNQVATFTINPANRWIALHANAENDTFTIGHTFASAASQYDLQNENQEPEFGGVVKIPYNGFDEAGHLSTFGNRTIKIPLPFLNVAEGDVVTGLTLDAAKGAFTMTKTNVGQLTISDFDLGEDGSAILSSDSINTAFAKLQVQMNTEVHTREEAVNKEIEDRNTAIAEEINKLDSTDNLVELVPEGAEVPTNLFVNKVVQTDGVVSVEYKVITETDLPVSTILNTTEFTYDYEEPVLEEEIPPVDEGVTPAVEGEDEIVEIPAKTIQWLFDKVAALEARIFELEHPTQEEPEETPEGGEDDAGGTPTV